MSKTKGSGGGGVGMNKNVNVSVKTGSKTTEAISVPAASRIGTQVITTNGGVKLVAANVPQTPLGNQIALNVGAGGPGAGRSVLPSGSQGKR
jgi:hypothetical protein